MRVSLFISFIISILLPMHLIAQDAKNPIIPDTPPSPQAVAFNRLGDYEVNNNYGAPDINIPLWEIDFHGYKIPLSLHYEAKPLTPGYNYDVTGLGWTLSGNSCVSRTIKDRADEYGKFSNPFQLDNIGANKSRKEAFKYKDYADKLDQLNLQYDSYNIVLPSGRSIPFFMDKESGTMKYSLMEYDKNVKIECDEESMKSFIVTDEKGVKYYFTEPEMATNVHEGGINDNRYVTWLLTCVYIPGKGTVSYSYTDKAVDVFTQNSVDEYTTRVSRMYQQNVENSLYVSNISCPARSNYYKMKLLTGIRYGTTNVKITYTKDDLFPHMSEIAISDNDTAIRKYSLGYTHTSYSFSTLASIVISGQGDKDKLVYGFTYWDNGSIGGYTDYWGNLCNSRNNKGLGNFNMYVDFIVSDLENKIKRYGDYAQILKNDSYSYYEKIKLQSSEVGTGDAYKPASPYSHYALKSITYPNGGSTYFTWENHRFITATAANGNFIYDRRKQRIIEGGGVRIKSVINKTADGKIASEDHYRYGFTYDYIIDKNFPLPVSDSKVKNHNSYEHIGCGEPVVDPNLLTFMSPTYGGSCRDGFLQMLVGLPSDFKNVKVYDRDWWWDADFSFNTFRSRLNGRRPVVYPEITVYHGDPDNPDNCKSKTVYKYDIYDYQTDPTRYYQASIFKKDYSPQTLKIDTTYFEYMTYADAELICRNKRPTLSNELKSKYSYSYNINSSTWDLVSEEDYKYSNDNIEKKGSIYKSSVSRKNMPQNLANESLSQFYEQGIPQRLEKYILTDKTTTILRKGGTRDWDNTQTESYDYLYSGVMKSKTYTDGYDKEDVYSYVGEDDSDDSVITEMRKRNMLASMLNVETTSSILPHIIDDGDDRVFVAGSKIDYGFYGNNILPSKLYESNGEKNGNPIYEASIEVLSYDAYGNPTEIQDLKTGVNSVFLWDESGRYMTALIKDTTYAEVKKVSLTGNSQSRYATLKARFPKAMIQTWDYKPLIGVSSYTDATGKTVLYEYDGLGRLISEKRKVNGVTNLETLREYEYNYKNK